MHSSTEKWIEVIHDWSFKFNISVSWKTANGMMKATKTKTKSWLKRLGLLMTICHIYKLLFFFVVVQFLISNQSLAAIKTSLIWLQIRSDLKREEKHENCSYDYLCGLAVLRKKTWNWGRCDPKMNRITLRVQ